MRKLFEISGQQLLDQCPANKVQRLYEIVMNSSQGSGNADLMLTNSRMA